MPPADPKFNYISFFFSALTTSMGDIQGDILSDIQSFIEGAEEGGCKDKIQELVKANVEEKIKNIEETRKTFNAKIEGLENTDKYVIQAERTAIDTAKASKSHRSFVSGLVGNEFANVEAFITKLNIVKKGIKDTKDSYFKSLQGSPVFKCDSLPETEAEFDECTKATFFINTGAFLDVVTGSISDKCVLRANIATLFGKTASFIPKVLIIISNLLGLFYFNVITVTFCVFKLLYNIYEAIKATDMDKKSSRWGTAVGYVIRIIRALIGVRRRKLRKLRK